MSDSQKPVQFSLNSIKTVQFATVERDFSQEKEAKVESGFDFLVNNEKESIIVLYKCTYLCVDKPFIKLEVACEFKVESKSFKEFLIDAKDQYIVPKAFIIHLAFLTVGTSRGILHTKLEGTKFGQFILPTIDLTKMVKSDIIFRKTKEAQTKEKTK